VGTTVPIVLKPMPLSPSGRKRQNWIQSIKCLKGSLLVNTEYNGMLGRIHV
jgi:hypothetical protein